MTKESRIVAELGRPETAEETAARKAEATRVYRSSQTMRNLVAALIVTLAIVAVIIFAVPRGVAPERPAIDVAKIAQDVETSTGSRVLVPTVDKGYQVNAAAISGSSATAVWKVTLAPTAAESRGFLNVAQALDTDSSWAPQELGGIAPTDEITIDGRAWDVYKMPNPELSRNISYAIGTQAGTDYVLLYGALSADDTAAFASSLSDQITEISEAQ